MLSGHRSERLSCGIWAGGLRGGRGTDRARGDCADRGFVVSRPGCRSRPSAGAGLGAGPDAEICRNADPLRPEGPHLGGSPRFGDGVRCSAIRAAGRARVSRARAAHCPAPVAEVRGCGRAPGPLPRTGCRDAGICRNADACGRIGPHLGGSPRFGDGAPGWAAAHARRTAPHRWPSARTRVPLLRIGCRDAGICRDADACGRISPHLGGSPGFGDGRPRPAAEDPGPAGIGVSPDAGICRNADACGRISPHVGGSPGFGDGHRGRAVETARTGRRSRPRARPPPIRAADSAPRGQAPAQTAATCSASRIVYEYPCSARNRCRFCAKSWSTVSRAMRV